MHLTSLLPASISKRLVPAIYGITKTGVHVQTQFQIDHTSTGSAAGAGAAFTQVGEDAAFVTAGRSGRYHVCGVADGVGGWNQQGVDPSFFSKVLIESCSRVSTRESVDLCKPVNIITRAFKEVLWFHSQCYGSSTLCVLTLDSNTGLLHSGNLGDSGCLVMRKGKIIDECQTLTHYFNCPFQLSNLPPGFNKTLPVDKPSSTISSSIKVEEGDLVLLGTDGLFDNMYTSEIVDMLQDFKYLSQEDLDKKVKEIVEKSYKNSVDSSYMSPFAQSGSQALSWEYQGGKPDDITVILAAVMDCLDETDPP